MLIGIVLAGLLAAVLPADFFQTQLGNGPVAKLTVLLCALPLYICSSASVPVAASLIAAGASPGTALVLLVAGPGTNIAALLAVRRVLGGRPLAIIVVCTATVAFLAGTVLDLMAGPAVAATATACLDCHDTGWEDHVAAGVLLALLASAFLPHRTPAASPKGHRSSCCHKA